MKGDDIMKKPIYIVTLYDGDGRFEWQAINQFTTSDHKHIRESIVYAKEMGYTVGMYCMPDHRRFVAKPENIYEQYGGFYCKS